MSFNARKLLMLVGALATVSAAWISIFPDFLTEKYPNYSDFVALAPIGTLVGVLVVVVSIWLETEARLESVEKAIGQFKGQSKKGVKDVQSTIQSSLQDAFTRIDETGSIRSTANYDIEIFDKVIAARSIRNTFAGMEGLDKNVSDPFKLYDHFFKNVPNGSWDDVVGIRDVNATRYEKMNPQNPVKVHILKHSPPIVNFIILDYPDGTPTEVYFGWLSSPDAAKRQLWTKDPSVFHTNHQPLVQLFEDYFRFLAQGYTWRNRPGPHLELSQDGKGLTPILGCEFINKSGWWVSHMNIRKSGDPQYYALIKFNFDYGALKDLDDIEVVLFDHNLEYVTNAAHKQTLAHNGNELHFRWSQKEAGKLRKGYCTYTFSGTDNQASLGGHVVFDDANFVGRLSGRRLSTSRGNYLSKLLAGYPKLGDTRERELDTGTKAKLEIECNDALDLWQDGIDG